MSEQYVAQIREAMAFIPQHKEPADRWAELCDRDVRHRALIGPLVPCVGLSLPCVDRARSAAGRMLGCSTEAVRHRANVWKRRGSYEAAKAWITDLTGGPWPVGELPEQSVGYVYVLGCPNFPGLFKVGFSRSPEVRRRALERQYSTALTVEHIQVATWLDEHMTHLSLLKFQMASEWFDMAGVWAGKLPVALFYTPARMWSELTSEIEGDL